MNLLAISGVVSAEKIGVTCLAMLISFACAIPAQASSMQVEPQPAKVMSGGMQVTECLPCAFCYMAPPLPERVEDNPDKLYLSAIPWVCWSEATIGYLTLDLRISQGSTVAVRILFCRWAN